VILSIVQVILFVVLFSSLIYNIFAQKKHWVFTVLLLFFFLLTQIYEDDLLDRTMYNQDYGDESQQSLIINHSPEKTTSQIITANVSSVLVKQETNNS